MTQLDTAAAHRLGDKSDRDRQKAAAREVACRIESESNREALLRDLSTI